MAAGIPRQEHARTAHVLGIARRKSQHPPLFYARKRVISKKHAHEQQEYYRPWPHGKESERRDAQAEILWMADIPVHPRHHHLSTKHSRAVDLHCESKESHQTQAESVTAQVPT